MTFGKDFTQAVEQKQIAQQEAERAKFIVERSEQERQAAVVRAEGEAEAATIISRALSKAGDGLVQFRRIEASKEIAGTLANVRLSLFSLSRSLSFPCFPLVSFFWLFPITDCVLCLLDVQGRNVTYLPGGGNVLLQVSGQQ